MAKEYITYDEYLSRARKEAQSQQEAYVQSLERQTNEQEKALRDDAFARQSLMWNEAKQGIGNTISSYEGLYDENAVREQVEQRNVAERLANVGLTDSGLNRTQQTALATARARADAGVSLKKQQAVDTLLNQINEAIRADRAKTEQAIADARASMYEQEASHMAALEKETQESAKANFEADFKLTQAENEAEFEREKDLRDAAQRQWEIEQDAKLQQALAEYKMQTMDKELEEQIKKWEAEAELQKQKQQDAMELQRQKQSDSMALQTKKQEDATELQRQKQSDSMALQTKKQEDATALQQQKQSDSMALQTKRQEDATELQRQKQSDSAALQRQKAADSAAASQKASASKNKNTELTAAQRAEIAESLRKALSDRTTVYNESLREDYDRLIAYYESQLY